MKEEELQTSVEEERDQLNDEIRRLEAALIEAKEVTSVKAVEDAHDEFAVKLRESRKQKSRLEEELEEQADRARTERRRLNNEIDELEQSLQRARTELRKASAASGEVGAVNREELDEAIAARDKAEDAFTEARKKHAAEIESLQEQKSTLESRLVEAIERSSNPARTNDADRARVEIEIEARTKQIQHDAHAELGDARKEWESERGKLALEIDRLKRSAAKAPAPAGAPAPTEAAQGEIQELKARVGALDTERTDLEKQLSESKAALGEAQATASRIVELEQAIETGKGDAAALHESAERFEAERATWGEERSALEEKLQNESDARAAERGHLETQVRELEASLEQAHRADPEEAKRRQEFEARALAAEESLAKLEEKLAATSMETETARQKLEARAEAAAKSAEELEEKLRAATDEREAEGAERETRAQAAAKSAAETEENLENRMNEAAEAREQLEDKVRLIEESAARAEKEHHAAAAEWESDRMKLSNRSTALRPPPMRLRRSTGQNSTRFATSCSQSSNRRKSGAPRSWKKSRTRSRPGTRIVPRWKLNYSRCVATSNPRRKNSNPTCAKS